MWSATPLGVDFSACSTLAAPIYADHQDVRFLPAAPIGTSNCSAATILNQPERELVVIDENVPDYQQLVVDILAAQGPSHSFDILLLNPNADGIAQIDKSLNGCVHYDAVQFISHGTAGMIQLGSTWLNTADLNQYSTKLRGWSAGLNPGADLLFYACDVASSADGQDLLRSVAGLTHANVAGSADETGAPQLGGNWDLEFKVGRIDTPVPFTTIQEAQWQHLLAAAPAGAEFQINTYTTGAQQTFPQTPQAVAMNPMTGDYVVTWSSQGQIAGGGWDVYFQRYNSAGAPQGPETLVDTHANGVNQQYATVAMNSSGNFVVTWSGNQNGHWNIYAQMFNSVGVAQGAVIPVSVPAGYDQEYSTVAMDASGNFVVSWSGHQSGNWNTYAEEFNASGASISGVFGVSTPINGKDQMFADVAMNAAGNFVITWSGHQSGHWSVYAQLYAPSAMPAGSIIPVSTNTTDDQEYSTAAIDASGDLIITWSGHQNGHWNVYAQSYLSSGTPVSTNFQVNATTNEDQQYSSVTYDNSGTATITWSSKNQDGDGWGVFLQQANASGALVGGQRQVNTYTKNDQFYSSIAGEQDGDFVVVWTSNNQDGSNFGVFGRQFNATMPSTAGVNATGSNFLVSQDGSVVRVNSLTGAVIATYVTNVANDGITSGPDGSLYVSDYVNNRILYYDVNGTAQPSFGVGHLISPQGLAIGPDGNVYVTNTNGPNNGFVDKFSPTGTFLGTFIAPGSGGLSNAKAIVWGPDGNAYVTSFDNSEVIRYNGLTGAFMNVFATGSGGFEDLTFGPDGNLFVASYGSGGPDGAIYRYNGTTGASLGIFASGITTAYGLRFDPAGNLDVSSRSPGQIQTYNGITGAPIGNLDTGLANPAYITAPTSLLTSETGTTATFSIALNFQPTANVTVNLSVTRNSQGSLSPSSLTFTPADWNVAQTVTVTGLDDMTFNGNQAYTINGVATSVDANYDGLIMNPVTVINTEADVQTLTTIASSTISSVYGQTVALTAIVNLLGVGIPTGSVSFSDNGNDLADASLVSGAATLTTSTLSVGTHHISVEYDGAFLVAQSESNSLTLIVAPASLTITANNKTMIYGGSVPALDATYNGLVNGDTSAVVTGLILSTSATSSSNVGVYTIAASGGAAANYIITDFNGALTVTPAALTITANNKSMTYGGSLPALDATYTGLVNGDTSAVVTGLSLTTNATSASNVGVYSITASGGTDANYTITDYGATLTVTPAALTITANNKSMTYGGSVPTLDATYTGLVNGDTSAVVAGLSLTTNATSASNVGVYSITASGGADPNYSITDYGGTLTITPASLTITANNKSMTYGGSVPTLDATFSGLVNGDTSAVVTGLTLSTTATSSTNASAYAITASGGTAANYTVTDRDGVLTIGKAALVITANDKSMTYGANVPTLDATFTGLVNGDTSAMVTGLALATTATSGSNVGSYTITATGGVSANYTIVHRNGLLTITPAALLITANNKSTIYGAGVPALDATFTGLMNGDTSAVVAGLNLSANATSGSNVGTYTITATGGIAPNYAITDLNGSLTIAPATLLVTASDASKVYGQANPVFSDNITGFVNGDSSTVVSGSATLSTPATVASGVGSYPIVAGAGSLNAANYNFAFTDGTLEVTPATLTVAANDVSRAFGNANPTFTDTISGFVNGDTAAVVSGNASLATAADATSGVGAYAISTGPGTLNAANYTFRFVDGVLTITPVVTLGTGVNVVNPPALTSQPSLIPATLAGTPVLATPSSNLAQDVQPKNVENLVRSQPALIATKIVGVGSDSGEVGGGVAAAPPAPPPIVQADPPAGPAETTASRSQEPPPAVTLPAVGQFALPYGFDEGVLSEKLDSLKKQIDDRKWHTMKDAAVLTTILASAGYVLLNGRGLTFLVSLLTSRPLWKRFDPLEILFVWEQEKKRRQKIGVQDENDDDETLQSLVVSKV